MKLKESHCVVTGASRGLGLEIARAFWSEGANLTLVGRSRTSLESAQRDLGARSNQTAGIICADLADKKSAQRIVEIAVAANGAISVLVNNAAIQGPIGPVWKTDWAEWQQVMSINLLGPIELCRRILPEMCRRRYGKIVNVSGGGATGPRPNFTAYATAKTGLVRFSESLAAEAAPFNVHVNCVAPGAMSSAMTDEVIAAGPERSGQVEYNAAVSTRATMGAPFSKAAALCAFLASSESDGITGRLISAVWDDWSHLPQVQEKLSRTDIFTLRRITPKDRGQDW